MEQLEKVVFFFFPLSSFAQPALIMSSLEDVLKEQRAKMQKLVEQKEANPKKAKEPKLVKKSDWRQRQEAHRSRKVEAAVNVQATRAGAGAGAGAAAGGVGGHNPILTAVRKAQQHLLKVCGWGCAWGDCVSQPHLHLKTPTILTYTLSYT